MKYILINAETRLFQSWLIKLIKSSLITKKKGIFWLSLFYLTAKQIYFNTASSSVSNLQCTYGAPTVSLKALGYSLKCICPEHNNCDWSDCLLLLNKHRKTELKICLRHNVTIVGHNWYFPHPCLARVKSN